VLLCGLGPIETEPETEVNEGEHGATTDDVEQPMASADSTVEESESAAVDMGEKKSA